MKLACKQRKLTKCTSLPCNEKVSRTFWVPPTLRSSAFLTFDFLSVDFDMEHFFLKTSCHSKDKYIDQNLLEAKC
jgi:hypothetical protein